MPQASTPKGKQEFDVFLCHNSKDKPEVKRIAELLKAQGIVPWLDEWELRPGLPWQRALEEQIEHIKTTAVFVGSNGRGPWQDMELEAFIREFVSRGCPVIPVVLADAPDKPQLPAFLRGMTWVDFRVGDYGDQTLKLRESYNNAVSRSYPGIQCGRGVLTWQIIRRQPIIHLPILVTHATRAPRGFVPSAGY